jgi:hypothetical protein
MEKSEIIQTRPVLFDMNDHESRGAYVEHKRSDARYVDAYDNMLEELCHIKNPSVLDEKFGDVFKLFKQEMCFGKDVNDCGFWVYYPWRNTYVHFLPPAEHHELHTARNKNLITEEEQKKFADFSVGIAGMSVGSHAALTLAMSGGCHKMKLADPDFISGSNLNRLRYGFADVGKSKVSVVAENIYEINPYASLELFDKGISESNFENFVKDSSPIGAFVEEVDNMEMKIKTRMWAKEYGLPVVMVTDNADGVIVDVERYDLDSDLPLFGRKMTIDFEKVLQGEIKDKAKIISEIVDFSLVGERMLNSFGQVGKTLYSWPQLGTAALLAGVITTVIIKKLALRQPCPSGRSVVGLDDLL